MIGDITPDGSTAAHSVFTGDAVVPVARATLGMIPLPSKWYIEFGEPVRTDCYDRGSADDPMLVVNLTDQVRETIQQTLHRLLIKRRNPLVG
jgi:hypothetical protein